MKWDSLYAQVFYSEEEGIINPGYYNTKNTNNTNNNDNNNDNSNNDN